MMAARMADQIIPVKNGVDSCCDMMINTRSAFAFSSGVVRKAFPIMPIAMAAIREMITHTMAIRVDFLRSSGLPMAMKRTRMCG